MAGLAYNYNLTAPYGMVLGVMDMTQVGTASLVYATYFGGSDIQEVRGIAFDAAGNLLVTGYTLATDFPVTPDAVQPKAGGNGDAFVSVVNPYGLSEFSGVLHLSGRFARRGGDMALPAIARATSTSPATRSRRTFRPPPTRSSRIGAAASTCSLPN